MRKTCFRTKIAGYPILLVQTGRDRFTVTYYKQVRSGLDYAAAGKELGYDIMHAAACAGKLDNREPGEE